MTRILILLSGLGFCACAAMAETAVPPSTSRPGPSLPPPVTNRFSAGAAVIVSESPYIGADTRFLPVPFLNYRSPRFQVTGLRASYSVWRKPFYSLSTVGQWRFSPFDEEDSPALDGLHSRDPGLEAGLRLAGPRFLPLETGLEVRGDTLGSHDGLSAAFDLGWRFIGRNGFFRPSLRLEWQSPALADYLYGVSEDESRADRPAYDPGDTLHCGLDGIYVRTFANRWEWTLTAGVNLLDKEAADSPIVEHTAVWRTLTGIGYRF